MRKLITSVCLVALGIIQVHGQLQRPLLEKNTPLLIELKQAEPQQGQLELLKEVFRFNNGDEFRMSSTTQDDLGFTHDKLQQYYKGIPVEGAFVTTHSKQGTVRMISGECRQIVNLNVEPAITEAQAYTSALKQLGIRKLMSAEPSIGELVVAASIVENFAPHLAYKFDIYGEEPLYRAWVFVDAHTGDVFMENARIHEANVPATGTSLYNGTVSFTADQVSATSYRLRQTSSGGGVQTFNLRNGTNYSTATDFTSTTSSFTADGTAVQAHWGAEKTHSYYFVKHGRNSYNNAGGVLKSYVHYSRNYVNAFWDGTRMTYGDGNGTNYGPLVSMDITGHEITHGVTEYSANLVYQKESGALNESFSDIFGEMIEYYATGNNDWQMGTDIGIGGSGAIRSMNNPNAFTDPDTYGGSYWINPNCTPSSNNDYCGVHTNSGVQNKWFYILAIGENGTNDLANAYSVTGVGRDKAAAITYRSLTTYLTTTSTFASARAGSIQAATDLYGANSVEVIAVTNAWYAVGVGAAYQPPVTDTQAPTAPGSLAAGSITATTASLSWTASTDNVGVTSYQVFLGGVLNGTSTSTSYSLSGLTANTGYSAYVKALDAAGNASAASNTVSFTTLTSGGGGGSGPTTLFSGYFETGLDGWIDGGVDCARTLYASRSYEGSYSMVIQDNSGVASSMTSPVADVSSYTQLDLQFYFYAVSMETGEDFFVQYFNGSAWQNIAQFASGSSFNNNTFYVVNLTLGAGTYAFPSNAQVRIYCDASANDDKIYVDAVSLVGSSPIVFGAQSTGLLVDIQEVAGTNNSFVSVEVEGIKLYPNPASDEINVLCEQPIKQIKLYTIEGKELVVDQKTQSTTGAVDIASLTAGVYLLVVKTENEVYHQKFVKQ